MRSFARDNLPSLADEILLRTHTVPLAIISRHSVPGTPPLLKEPFGACIHPLAEETQEDILTAFYVRYDSDLYLDMKANLGDVPAHVPHNQSFFEREEERPVFTSSLKQAGTTIVKFVIPRFLDRLEVDKETTHEFLAQGDRQPFFILSSPTTDGLCT
ncbi:hypothetical protein NMY22_g6732 [Coprinellus aureogranulatus]|nr:hypothetical protein NMY22_g6732 [Coprinellus aureogranulatus]